MKPLGPIPAGYDVLDGELAPLISHFAEHRKLSPQEVSRLKALIDEMGDDQ